MRAYIALSIVKSYFFLRKQVSRAWETIRLNLCWVQIKPLRFMPVHPSLFMLHEYGDRTMTFDVYTQRGELAKMRLGAGALRSTTSSWVFRSVRA